MSAYTLILELKERMSRAIIGQEHLVEHRPGALPLEEVLPQLNPGSKA